VQLAGNVEEIADFLFEMEKYDWYATLNRASKHLQRLNRAAQSAQVPAPQAGVEAGAGEVEESKWDNGFMAGVCVALATVTLHYDSVIWKEIVQSVGTDSLLNYAANVNPEDWDLAGFGKYAQVELGKGKPDPAPQAGEVKA
jgi:hypothetical protein